MTPAVRIVQCAPCLVYAWPEQPAPHEVYALEHELAAKVWRASEGQRWDVVTFHAWERSTFLAGARLVLDDEGYERTRAAEVVLERVRDAVAEVAP